MYLAHPIALTYFGFLFEDMGVLLNVPMTVVFYLLAVGATLLLAIGMRKLGERIPVINKATIGVYPRK